MTPERMNYALLIAAYTQTRLPCEACTAAVLTTDPDDVACDKHLLAAALLAAVCERDALAASGVALLRGIADVAALLETERTRWLELAQNEPGVTEGTIAMFVGSSEAMATAASLVRAVLVTP